MGGDLDSFLKVKQKVREALNSFATNEQQLLHIKASERSISHKFAEHLQKQFSTKWNVDCEYNRRGTDVKRLSVFYNSVNTNDLEAKTVFPDIIVHTREDRAANQVIEIKKSNSHENHDKDISKLKAFTDPDYNYKFGLLLIFDVEQKNNPKWQWFKNGEKISNLKSVWG